jgi:transcriptional regulator with XRE-family HTH domain
MSKSKPGPTMTDVLRSTIEQSGVTHYRIASETGIPAASLSRFMAGNTSLRLDRADVLAQYLGLRLVLDSDAVPPEPTPENLARPMLTKRKAKAKRTRRPRGKGKTK